MSCCLLMYSSSTSLLCLQTAVQSSSLTAGKCSHDRCWTSPSLNFTFLWPPCFSQYLRFVIWSLNQGGMEVVWSLCVHA
jgi:hypothetical protein